MTWCSLPKITHSFQIKIKHEVSHWFLTRSESNWWQQNSNFVSNVSTTSSQFSFDFRVLRWSCVRCIGGFHVTSSPPCWWTKTKDLSLASFVRPPEVVHFSIVIGVPRGWLKTSHTVYDSAKGARGVPLFRRCSKGLGNGVIVPPSFRPNVQLFRNPFFFLFFWENCIFWRFCSGKLHGQRTACDTAFY